MKKLIGILVVITLICSLCIALAACGEEEDPTPTPTTEPEEKTYDFKSAKEILAAFAKGKITAAFEGTAGESSASGVVTVAKNAEAIYVKAQENEYVYTIADTVLYEKEEGVWRKLGTGAYYKTIIETAAKGITTLLNGYTLSAKLNDVYTISEIGTETVCGRECTKFAFEAAGAQGDAAAVYSIDNLTGMCLKCKAAATSAEGDSGSGSWTVTEFNLGDVDLGEIIDALPVE